MTDNKSHLSQYSFQDSQFDVLEKDGVKTIRKETRFHEAFKNHSQTLHQETLHYFDLLLKNKIPVPDIHETSVNPEAMLFVCSYKGHNILQSLDPLKPETLFQEVPLLDQVTSIIKTAQEANLYLDPHIKNFVHDAGKVYYVDFTPPWTENYFNLRLSIANANEKNILTDFFSCMAPQALGYHFAADFLKMAHSYKSMMPRFYTHLKSKNLLEGNFDSFMEIAEKIMDKERRRERERVFLL